MDPALAIAFLARNLDLVPDPRDRAVVLERPRRAPADEPNAGRPGRAILALLQNRDPERVDALLAALPLETRALLDTLSPARHLGHGSARLLLVHGRDDPAIPFSESLRLRRRRARALAAGARGADRPRGGPGAGLAPDCPT